MSVFLKVKIKSLAAEARIIRREEHRRLRGARWVREKDIENRRNLSSPEQDAAYVVYHRLHHHRTVDVRDEARCAQIAYGFLRGRELYLIDACKYRCPDWGRVQKLTLRYHERRDHELDKTIKETLALWVKRSPIPEDNRPSWK